MVKQSQPFYSRHHKRKKEKKVREKKHSSSQSADEESDKEKKIPGNDSCYKSFAAVLKNRTSRIFK